ncbi:MAG: methyltransferase domain-containing protein [Acidobacteriota bacterium]
MAQFLRRALAHPLTINRDLHLDNPETTDLHRAIIQSKPFLKSIYEEWYRLLAKWVPGGTAPAVELGSGAGFSGEFVPGLITSEVCFFPSVHVVFDGQAMPFRTGSLRGITMVNVLHHVPDVRMLFEEAVRCLRPGGRVVAIEPWVSPWSRFVYTNLHHEPFDAAREEWAFPKGGRLSAANGALPWIVFERDRRRWEEEFPDLQVKLIRGIMPFRYLVSGGIATRNLTPAFCFPLWRAVERLAEPFMRSLAMFALIVIERR